MTADVRISLNSAGIRALLRSAEVSADLGGRADRIAAAAGPGFEARTEMSGDRAIAFVRTATPEARTAQAERRALTSAITAGG